MAPQQIVVAAGAALGSGPPAPTFDTVNTSNDERGIIQFGTGTGPTTGTMVTLTFPPSWNGYDPMTVPLPSLRPVNKLTYDLGIYTVSWDLHILTIGCEVAPAASQSGTTYLLGYQIQG